MAESYSRRRIGDRRDGRRLSTLSPLFLLTPFFMRSPSDALNSFTDQIEIGAMEQWVLSRREQGHTDISIMHIFIAAYVRTLSQYPALNRFVAGRFLYSRDWIEIVLSSGRNGSADAGAMTAKIRFLPTDTVFDVCRKINAQIDSIKADEDASRLERLAATLVKTPRFVLRIGTAFMRWLDYHGWLDDRWTGRSPFHGSAVISDEGANGLPSFTRSLNSMGSLPLSLSIGRRRTSAELSRTGQLCETHSVDYTVCFDSRIADSAYLGAAFKLFRQVLQHPEELEEMPSRVNDDAL